MDLPLIIGVAGTLFVLFLIVGAWQRGIDRVERAEALERLKDSHDRGTLRPLAQYPQIKPYLCIGCGSCIKACPEEGVLGLVNGIAHVIQGNHCVGHARCQDACPVMAITVGLGDLKSRPDIPILHDYETSVPGVYIAGELAGIALIRHAVDQGARAVDCIAQKLHAQARLADASILDLLIVGAGPTGLSASLQAIAKKLNYLTISQDDIGGTIRKYPRRKLTLVQSVRIPLHGTLRGGEYTKEMLVELWDQLIQKYGVRVKTGIMLTGLKRQGSCLEIQTSAGVVRTRTVLLGLGRRGTPRKLGVPGEDQEKVLYQLLDASTYTGQKLLVIGGGDSAVEAAIGLTEQPGNTVHLSYRKEAFTRLKARNEARLRESIDKGRVKILFNSQVASIEPQSVELAVEQGGLKRALRLPNDFVFIFAGGDPPYPLLHHMGIRFGGESQEAFTGHARFA